MRAPHCRCRSVTSARGGEAAGRGYGQRSMEECDSENGAKSSSRRLRVCSSVPRGARSTEHDVRGTWHGVHVTSGSFAQAIHWLPRHSGSACAPRLVVRFSVGHGPQDTGAERGWARQRDARCAEEARSAVAAGVAGRAVAVARRAARTTARGSLRVCGGSGGWRRRRETKRRPRAGLPGGVRHLRQGGQALQDGERLGLGRARPGGGSMAAHVRGVHHGPRGLLYAPGRAGLDLRHRVGRYLSAP